MDNKNEEIEIIDIEEFNMTPETNGDSTSTNEPIQEDIIIPTDAEEVTESLFGSPINEEKENIVWEKPVEEIDYLFDINEEMALESSTSVESQMREMEVENSKIRQDFMQEVEEYNKDVAETVIEDLDYTITGKVGAKNPYLDTEEVTKAFISSLYNSENSQDIEIVPETPLQTYDKNVIEKLDAEINKDEAMEEALSHTTKYSPFETPKPEVAEITENEHVNRSRNGLILVIILFVILFIAVLLIPKISTLF